MAAADLDGNNSTAYIVGDRIEQSRKGMTTSYSLSPSKFNRTAAPEYDFTEEKLAANIDVKVNGARVKQSSIFSKTAQPKKVAINEDAEFEQAEQQAAEEVRKEEIPQFNVASININNTEFKASVSPRKRVTTAKKSSVSPLKSQL